MSLQGKITGIEGDFVIVEVEPRPECNGCHACTGLLDGEKRSAKKTIRALTAEFKVDIGDEVLLDLNPGEGSVAALLIFGLPVAGFFAGMALTPWLCHLTGCIISDVWRLVYGFTGMALAFGVVAIAARTRQAERLSLKVVQVISCGSSHKPELD
ncbi:MAG: hypothetical protein CVV41_20825 [Candidatus Riflebacteria bacterium HGW-Riflebacteria-1]|jgi:positive regulator of sigma E activity|nr:MAG: hypothetical protein CVV41_20825 [Candidatus Riflebacteria bacterium HGW-Riflebacteria-1]